MKAYRKDKQAADSQKEADNDLVFSYLTMRNLIGFSGMLLALILVLTTSRGTEDKIIEPSISDYYYSTNGDVLVVVLSVLGVFLFTYKGYGWKERTLTLIAAVCGISVAFSPTASQTGNSFSIHKLHEQVPLWFGIERHFVFAGLFFLSLALICLIYFPKTNKSSVKTAEGKRTAKEKKKYNVSAMWLDHHRRIGFTFFIFQA